MNLKTVLITGATSGIGKATAYLFAQNGYHLILTGRREDRLIEIKADLESKYKISVYTFCFDIQNRTEVSDAFSKIKSLDLKIDILVNNAGLALGKSPFQEGLESDWETMIDTNLKGLIYITKEVAALMVENKSGHIINISSTAARDMYLGGNVYSASKAAVDAFTQSLRIDLLPFNIKVSTVAPGMVNTEFSKVRFHGNKEKADQVYQGFQPLMAEDVADVIYYIASRPSHVNIGDILMTSTAQANSNLVHKFI